MGKEHRAFISGFQTLHLAGKWSNTMPPRPRQTHMIVFPCIQQGQLTFQDTFPACHLKLTVPSALTVQSHSLASDAPAPGPFYWLVPPCANATFFRPSLSTFSSFISLSQRPPFCFKESAPQRLLKVGQHHSHGKDGKIEGWGFHMAVRGQRLGGSLECFNI